MRSKILFLTLVLLQLIFPFFALAENTVKLGGIFSLTGWGAPGGIPERNGAVMAVEEINKAEGVSGQMIELIIEDNRSLPIRTLTTFKKLIDLDRVSAIVGPNWVEFLEVVAPVAHTRRVPLVAASGYSENVFRLNPAVFVLWPSIREQLEPLVAELIKQQITSVQLITSNNAFMKSIEEVLLQELDKHKIELTLHGSFEPDQTDYRSFLARAKLAESDALICLLLENGPLGAFLRQRKTLQITGPIFGINNFAYDQEVKTVPGLAAGAIYIDDFVPGDQAWKDRYRARFGENPQAGSARAYDAVYIIVGALERCKVSNRSLLECLKLTNMEGVSGTLAFDQYGRRKETGSAASAVFRIPISMN